jgi:hypothetical protein
VTGDLNGDRKPDVVVAGRRGTYALLNGLPTSSTILAARTPFLRSRGGLSVVRTESSSSGQTLVLRFLQPGFHHALSVMDAQGKERTFALGHRRAGEVYSLHIGSMPTGSYHLRAIRDGESQTLGPLSVTR